MIAIIVASILIGLIFAPLGCFVLWKKYSYFGDGLAHACLLAGVVSIVTDTPVIYSGIALSFVFAFIITRVGVAENNASIGMLSNFMLSVSLVILAIYGNGGIKISNLLFGDIISVDSNDLAILSVMLISVICFMSYSYKNILISVLSRDIAESKKINTNLIDFIFIFLLSMSILFAVKIVGSLLITSVILIPPLTARLVSSSPIRMIILSGVFSILMSVLGVAGSFYFDLPFSPMIIISGGLVYIISKLIS